MHVFFFFWIRGNLTPRKAHFVGPGEGVKPQLSQALTRDARPDSNSRPAVQISNPLPSRYAPWGHTHACLLRLEDLNQERIPKTKSIIFKISLIFFS